MIRRPMLASPAVSNAACNSTLAAGLWGTVGLSTARTTACRGCQSGHLCARCAEIWDPATGKWTKGAAMAKPRTYHSVAVLLPSGRVFTGGGGLCGNCATNHPDAQIYLPPNLFNADGTRAARPSISVSAATATVGSQVTVTGSTSLKVISIIRFGSSTHSVNTDQRRIQLCGSSAKPCTPATGTNKYTLTLPNDTGIVLPGYWMVFGLNTAGVPSSAKILKIGAAAPAVATTRQSTLSAQSAQTTMEVQAFDVTPAAPPVAMPPGTQLD
jgi:Domain of unknown function (DUF1929)